jgi:putative copper resistance protein D
VSLDPFGAAAVLAKALVYAATFAAGGATFFLAYGWGLLGAAERHSIRRTIGLLAALATLAGGARIALMAAWMAGEWAGLADPDLWRLAVRSGEGAAFVVRSAALALLVVPGAQRPGALPLVAAAAAAASFLLVGHVYRSGSPLLLALLAVHLCGVACWVGALVSLRLVARGREPHILAGPAQRFGMLALPVVGALLAAGAWVLAELLGSPGELLHTAYGRLFVAKLAAVAGLLACAALNKLRLTPRLEKGEARAVAALRTSINLEMALAAAILVLTAALTTLTGPASIE